MCQWTSNAPSRRGVQEEIEEMAGIESSPQKDIILLKQSRTTHNLPDSAPDPRGYPGLLLALKHAEYMTISAIKKSQKTTEGLPGLQSLKEQILSSIKPHILSP